MNNVKNSPVVSTNGTTICFEFETPKSQKSFGRIEESEQGYDIFGTVSERKISIAQELFFIDGIVAVTYTEHAIAIQITSDFSADINKVAEIINNTGTKKPVASNVVIDVPIRIFEN
jgi:hypothetical protein